jgi:hypothetical protein
MNAVKQCAVQRDGQQCLNPATREFVFTVKIGITLESVIDVSHVVSLCEACFENVRRGAYVSHGQLNAPAAQIETGGHS